MSFRSSARVLAIVAAFATPSLAVAQTLSGPALAAALRQGGYVIVMRHAHAPEAPPGAAQADRSNRNHERQLDAGGRDSAAAMGAALRALHLQLGAVWSSPTYRALETVRLARLGAPRIAAQLGDNGHSMQATSEDQASWLRARANETPQPGTDNIIVTQFPNIKAAFGEAAAGMADGAALVFRPSPGSSPYLVTRIAIGEWPLLAQQSKREEHHHGA